jgi:hypothetical protein
MPDKKPNFYMRMLDPKGDVSFLRFWGQFVIIAGLAFLFVYPEQWTGAVAITALGLGSKLVQNFTEKGN